MPQPTRTDVHVDGVLTNISVAYRQQQENFIATRVFPVVPVQHRSDKYYIYDKNAWLRDQMQRRPPATESAGSGYTLSTDSYTCEVWALHKDIDDQTRANADQPLDLERDTTIWLTQQWLLRQEIQWVTDFFTTGIWTQDYTGVAAAPGANQFLQWNDVTSDPISDIEAGKEKVLSTTGFEPNTLVLGYQVFRYLKQHPDIVDRIKYTSAQAITAGMIGAIFEIPRVFVAKAVKATNNEGGSATYAYTHGKAAWLGYVAPQPSLLAPSAGYTFMWQGVSGGLGVEVGVKRFMIDELSAERFEIQAAWDNKVVASDLGVFFTSAVA